MKFIKWLGTFTSIIGAFLVAMAMPAIGYCFFIVGAFCWLVVGFVTKENALILLNGVFFVANLIGFYNFVL